MSSGSNIGNCSSFASPRMAAKNSLLSDPGDQSTNNRFRNDPLGFGAGEFSPLSAEFGCCRYAVLQFEGWNYAHGQRCSPENQ